MSEHKINYHISKKAKLMLIALYLVFIAGIIIKICALCTEFNFFDVAYLILFLVFFVFSTAAVRKFLIQKQPVASISSNHISIAVPYFFAIQDLPLETIKEIKMSVWKRSEIVIFDAGEFRSFAFMAPFLANEDRESFLSNIFDLIPNVQVT